MRLDGRSVLITGGSRGLGLAMARAFLRQRARVAICARDEDELERAEADLHRYGRQVYAKRCDVTRKNEVDALVRDVTLRYGRVDVLVNNAGVIQVGPVETMTLDDYKLAMDVHFWGPLHAILAVLPQMRARREGRIVNISSIGGKVSSPHLIPYNASKFALTGLSEGLRAELARYRIRVTSVFPGLMRTGSPLNAEFKGRHRREYDWFSVSDSLPGLSIGAERAANQIVDAAKRGAAVRVLTVPAKAAVAFHGAFPGVTANLLGWVNRVLPKPGGIGTASALGRESTSRISNSFLTRSTREAARRNNEY